MQLNKNEDEILQILEETKAGETVTMANLVKETQLTGAVVSAAILHMLKLGIIEQVRKSYVKVVPFIETERG